MDQQEIENTLAFPDGLHCATCFKPIYDCECRKSKPHINYNKCEVCGMFPPVCNCNTIDVPGKETAFEMTLYG